MKLTEQVRIIAPEKVKEYHKCIDLLEPVLTAVEQFAGKSITGNRAKILDKIKQIDNNLYVSIDKEKGFTGYFYVFEITLKTTYSKAVNNNRLFCDSLTLFNVLEQNNIIDIDKIKECIKRTRERLTRDIEQTISTANNIELIVKQVKELKEKLKNLQYNSDTELTKLCGIDFNN